MAKDNALDEATVILKAGRSLLIVDRNHEYPEHYDVVLLEVRVKVPQEEDGEFLVILKGLAEQGALVAFHQAGSFFEAVSGALRRFQNKDLKWREDRPFGS